MRALSLFRGGFRAEAAQEVAHAPLAVLRGLSDKSLLRLAPAGRLDFHPLIHRYAREKLLPPEEERVEEAHGRFYLGLLRRDGAALNSPDQAAALRTLDEASENIRSAWLWAVAARDVHELHRSAHALYTYYDQRAKYQEGVAVLSQAALTLKAEEPEDAAALCSSTRRGFATTWGATRRRAG